MSAATTKNRTQPMQGRFKRIARNRRPITAKTRVMEEKAKLNNSLTNPFGSPGGEELLFNLEEKSNIESKLNDNDTPQNVYSNAMSILDKEETKKEETTSKILGYSKKFKRPQSAKPAFATINTLKNKQNNIHDFATLQLNKIFEKPK